MVKNVKIKFRIVVIKIKIGILEDDLEELNRFIFAINSRPEFELAFATSSVNEALEKTRDTKVEGIVVDIELNRGSGGSGFDYIKKLNELKFDIRPAIIVTTKNDSDLIEKTSRRLGTDMFYSKNKEDYCPHIVLNQFLIFQPSLADRKVKINNVKTDFETQEEREKRIKEKINEELNLIGAPTHTKGRLYLVDAIYYLIDNAHKDNSYYTNYICAKYHVRKNTISTAIQDAINYIWRNTPEEDILKNFTANITYTNGSPTPREFIHYYVDKVKKII